MCVGTRIKVRHAWLDRFVETDKIVLETHLKLESFSGGNTAPSV